MERKPVVTICCVCQKVKMENKWRKSVIPTDKIISHGYCPSCYRSARQRIMDYYLNFQGGIS